MRKQHTKAQRERLVRLVAEEGRTVREAAQQMKVRPSTAYYWVRQAAATGEAVVANTAASEPVFARLVRAEDAATPRVLELSIGGATVLVRPAFDAALLRAVVAYPPDRHHLAGMMRRMRQRPSDARRAT